MVITVEELKQKYGPAVDVAPYGSCIIVPGSEFNPDWEAELADQGVKVFLASLDQRPVTLVQVKKPVGVATLKGSEENKLKGPDRVVHIREKRSYASHGQLWSTEEDALLVKLYNQKPRPSYPKIFEKLQKQFPHRSLSSLTNHIGELQRQGKIKPKWTKKRPDSSKPELKTDTPSHTPTDTLSTKGTKETKETLSSTPLSLPEPAVRLLGDILFLLQKQNITLIMQGLEIKELKGQVKIPDSIYVAYGDALLEDDKGL